MSQSVGYVTFLIPNYDGAIEFFTETLGFSLFEDTPLGGGKRWVLVGPEGGGTRLVLAEPGDERQAARIGDQTGGRVFLFLHTDDFWRDYEALSAKGVRFLETPRDEPYGWVVVFEDLWGNRWDLLQLKQRAATAEA
jgi:catechol 2,3-dioxygenase-like lactoylglutathione lyase family enzyme